MNDRTSAKHLSMTMARLLVLSLIAPAIGLVATPRWAFHLIGGFAAASMLAVWLRFQAQSTRRFPAIALSAIAAALFYGLCYLAVARQLPRVLTAIVAMFVAYLLIRCFIDWSISAVVPSESERSSKALR